MTIVLNSILPDLVSTLLVILKHARPVTLSPSIMRFAPQVACWCSLLGLALFAACGEASRPNILIITVDTLRADYLGAYGDPDAVTPNLDELARSSTVFERAAAPMPMTRPSNFSMLTSKYPREHGVLNNSIPLPASALSVAEILNSDGYWTAAFVGVQLLSRKSGTSQGFDTYNLPRTRRERPAEDVVGKALQWLGNLPDEANFFLWVHLFDPHMPYDPPVEFRPAASGDLTAIDWQSLDEIASHNNGNISPALLEQSKALYRGEIAYIDHWIGELLKGIGEKTDLDNTLIVFTADHGECFENGIYFEHAHCLLEPALRIPLMVRYPKEFSAGARVTQQTSILDITPTILQAVEIEAPTDLSGRPLQEALGFSDRLVLLQHPYYGRELIDTFREERRHIQTVDGRSVIRGIPDQKRVGVLGVDWQYTVSDRSERLTRVPSDKREAPDLGAAHPEVQQQMYSELQRLLQQHPQLELAPNEVDDELRETLEALGYVN